MTTVPLFTLKPDYSLIDTSSIMAFSGAEWANPNQFLSYREKIWSSLESMIASDRLKTVRQVWPELEYNDPASCQRLQRLRNKFIIPTDDETNFSVFNLIAKYPKLIDKNQHFKEMIKLPEEL